MDTMIGLVSAVIMAIGAIATYRQDKRGAQ
jgi:hypothetical protein